jgi:predicted RecB family nuclease
MRLHSRSALLCHEYLHKTYAPSRFEFEEVIQENEVAVELKRLGIEHEEAVIQDLLLRSNLNFVDLRNRSRREEETAKALFSDDVDVILGASIGDTCEAEIVCILGVALPGNADRVSRPDLLVRTGTGESGRPSWAPVDIKSHSTFDSENRTNVVRLSSLENFLPNLGQEVAGRISKEDAFQLSHYVKHLEYLGLADSARWAGIIGREIEYCAWTPLDRVMFGVGTNKQDAMTAYEIAFIKAQRVIDIAIERDSDPQVPAPAIPQLYSGKFGCGGCEFQPACVVEMHEFGDGSGHVTLLATVTPDKVTKHFPNILSIQELMHADHLNDFGVKARIRAEVWHDGIPRLLEPSEPFVIPEFDIEVDIDLENSQAAFLDVLEEEAPGRDEVYLYGYGMHDRTVSKDWRTAELGSIFDYSATVDAEFNVLTVMWNMLVEIVERAEGEGKSIGIFHYSHHEQSWWRKFARRYVGIAGVPSPDEVEVFMANYFVDLLPVARKVSFKTSNYSVKSLAPIAGFNWEAEDAGGAQSLLKYQMAISADTQAERDEAIEWLRRYNLDDIRATFAVRDYLRSLNL